MLPVVISMTLFCALGPFINFLSSWHTLSSPCINHCIVQPSFFKMWSLVSSSSSSPIAVPLTQSISCSGLPDIVLLKKWWLLSLCCNFPAPLDMSYSFICCRKEMICVSAIWGAVLGPTLLRPGNSFLSSVGDMSLTQFMQFIWVLLHRRGHPRLSTEATVVGVWLTDQVDFLFKMAGIAASTFYASKGGKRSETKTDAL